MSRIRPHLSYANVMATIAVFLVLSGGTAVALSGSNTVQSDDLGPGAQVKAPDVADNAVNGADVVESSLGQVPSALLGGSGRWNGGESCNPESQTFNACAVVTRNLPARSRLLLVAQAAGFLETGEGSGGGYCHIGTTSGPLLDTQTFVRVEAGADNENLSLVGVTGPFPPGQHSFGIDCNEAFGGIRFLEAGISTVALSPG